MKSWLIYQTESVRTGRRLDIPIFCSSLVCLLGLLGLTKVYRVWPKAITSSFLRKHPSRFWTVFALGASTSAAATHIPERYHPGVVIVSTRDLLGCVGIRSWYWPVMCKQCRQSAQRRKWLWSDNDCIHKQLPGLPGKTKETQRAKTKTRTTTKSRTKTRTKKARLVFSVAILLK